jgi:hypothetical protein
MASFNLARDAGALEKGVVHLFARVDIGASGAPTIDRAKGINEVERVSAGRFKFTFGSAEQVAGFNTVLSASLCFAKDTVPTAPLWSAKLDAESSVQDGTIELRTFATGGTLTDPASGEVLIVHFVLSKSTAL